MAKDIGHVLGMILIPGTSRNLFPRLLDDAIINDEKKDRMGLDVQSFEESQHSRFHNLFRSPNVLSQESGKAGKGSMQQWETKGLDHRRSMAFFAQLYKTDDETRENLERRS
jgi:hypothetical protein